MKAIILAAGVASRLRPLTDSKPKCLLTIGTKCLLERTFDALIENGFKEFVVVTGYRQQQIVDFLQSHYASFQINVVYNERYEQTNNIYSLWLTKPLIKGFDSLLLDSDILFDPKIIHAVLSNPAPNVLALNNHELGDEEIKVIVNSQQDVMEISKVCSISKSIGESVGIEKMSAAYTEALFNELDFMIEKEGLDNVFYEQAFERIIPQGHTFKVENTTCYFSIELDTVQDFNQAEKLIPTELY